MPRYIANTDTWLSHECRLVRAGAEFDTVFPKVKTAAGEVEMRLGANLSLAEDDKPAKGKAKGGEALV